MPNGPAAAGMLIARFCISQMDVPARQAYVTMVVASDERSAANGITNVARSVGMLLSPVLVGWLSQPNQDAILFNAPWFISGGLKIIYDITLYSLYHCSTGLKEAEGSIDKKNDQEQLKNPLLSDNGESGDRKA